MPDPMTCPACSGPLTPTRNRRTGESWLACDLCERHYGGKRVGLSSLRPPIPGETFQPRPPCDARQVPPRPTLGELDELQR